MSQKVITLSVTRGFRKDSSYIIIFPIRSEVLPVLPLSPQPRMQHPPPPPDICTRRCWCLHSTARPLTTVSRASPPPKPGVARRSLRHLSPRPIDGRRAFFPRVEKKAGMSERDREAQENARGRREENWRTRVGKRRQRRRAGREGRKERESGSALPPKPVADQSPYVKRHFLWAPFGRPVCVIKIDLSPLFFFRKSTSEGEAVTARKSQKCSALNKGQGENRREREKERGTARAAHRL